MYQQKTLMQSYFQLYRKQGSLLLRWKHLRRFQFLETINHQRQMLLLYGTQSVVLLIGLFCLIIFSAKLYCENYKNKIACCLIEGYSMFHCIRNHLIVTVIYYVVVVVGLRFVSMTMQVSLNYLLLLVAFIGELAITLSVSRRYTQNNLYQIVKGAE